MGGALKVDKGTERAASSVILGTAGHIDHGKTALIMALTGIDTDRLKEEKSRGISIDLGFAHMDLPDGHTLGIVDVPGHERFIKNMLAGIGGIDFVLFVVACDEGIMPQTREHFDIVTILGVKQAVFALTKSDLADEGMIDLVRDEVEGMIRGTRFEGSPLIPTSVKTGDGVEEVRNALARVAGGIRRRKVGSAVRLPIDRVFTMTGRGTVVTGTLWSGRIRKEDRLQIQPGEKPVRVRSVEVHGHEVEEAIAGQRTALGLHGVEKSEIDRGYAVVSPGDFPATTDLDARLQVLASAPRAIKTGTRIRFHLGSSEVMGRVYLLESDALEPCGSGFVRLRLEMPVVAGLGDRFVLRTYSPMRTVGGGTVLDPLAPKHKRHDKSVIERLGLLEAGDLDRVVEAYIEGADYGLRPAAIRLRVNCGLDELNSVIARLKESGSVLEPTPGLYVHTKSVDRLEKRVEGILGDFQKERRLEWGMPKEELRERLGSVEMQLTNWVMERMERSGRLFTKRGDVRIGSGEVELTAEEQRARALIISLLRERPFQPPSEREIESGCGLSSEKLRRVVALLIQDGEVVRLEPGLIMHSGAIESAKEAIAAYLKDHGEATASELKDVLGTTRKYAVPLLEHLDRVGVTKRVGANRRLIG
jgi:selenocysteine-specific elongation factor